MASREELLKDCKNADDLLGKDGLVKDLTKALNLNPHLHVLVLDGVYIAGAAADRCGRTPDRRDHRTAGDPALAAAAPARRCLGRLLSRITYTVAPNAGPDARSSNNRERSWSMAGELKYNDNDRAALFMASDLADRKHLP